MIGFFTLLLGAVIAGTVVLVVAPLRRRTAEDLADQAADAELLAARAAAIQAIRELDFDYQLGNLAADDYRALRAQAKREAILLLKATPAGADAGPVQFDDAIERAVQQVRTRRPVGPRPGRWLAGGAAFTLAVVGGVAWLWFGARSAQQDQQPLAHLPAAAAVRALTFVPGRAGVALAGHRDGLLVSADGGRVWQPGAAAGAVLTLAAPAARPGAVYAAGPGLFLASADGGQTWAPLPTDLPITDIRALAADPEAANGLYAIAGAGLFRSDDGGARWQRVGEIGPRPATALAVASGMGGALYLATADDGILASADGRIWTSASGFVKGALPTRRIAALVYDPNSGDSFVTAAGAQLTGALYAGTDLGLFKSIDGGTNWTRLPLPAAVAALAVDPANAAVLLVVDSGGRVFRSADRGLTWRGEQ